MTAGVSAPRTPRAIMPALAVLLLIAAILSLGVGGVALRPLQVLEALWSDDDATAHAVVVAIRRPRILMAMCVGAGLAVAGGALQGLFRNPLVDPSFVGATSGGAMGATLTIVFGHHLTDQLPEALRPWAISLGSALGCLLLLQTTLALARIQGQLSIASLLLVGIALTALAGAVMGVCVFLADDAQARTITFWTLGSFGGASMGSLWVVAPPMIAAAAGLMYYARALDVLSLGEGEAAMLGVEVDRVKQRIVWLVALLVGVAVSATGQIGFVGLVVPHLVRLLLGPRHGPLLLASALLGALLLLVADTISRLVVLPAELPIGVVTGLIGAPFFLWLLRHQKAQLA